MNEKNGYYILLKSSVSLQSNRKSSIFAGAAIHSRSGVRPEPVKILFF